MKKLALLLALIMVTASIPGLSLAFNETGLPIVDEPATFSMMIDDNNEPDTVGFYDELERQTNIHVDLQLAPYQAQLERLGIALNSGD